MEQWVVVSIIIALYLGLTLTIGLMAGRVDVSWGGPMRVMMHHNEDPACPLICFGQVVSRDPFMLIGREPIEGFVGADVE